jgi:hypothetical protein
MKKILEKIFGVGSSVVDDVANALDRFIRTKEDRDAFEKEMTEIFVRAEAEMQKNVLIGGDMIWSLTRGYLRM